jgi:hypothetical protein
MGSTRIDVGRIHFLARAGGQIFPHIPHFPRIAIARVLARGNVGNVGNVLSLGRVPILQFGACLLGFIGNGVHSGSKVGITKPT